MSHPQTILDSLGANALKSLSQNFLTSPHWADLLTDKAIEPEADEIWEIGPGLGALTQVLLKKTTRPVRAFEFDRKLSAYLRETHAALDLREGDVMEADFAAVSPEAKRISVLSNLPYHLSSAILFKLLGERHRIVRLVLTFQKEFAQRLTAQPRTHDYGSLTIAMQLNYSIVNLGILPPGAFYPPPSVSSQALQLEPLPNAPDPMAEKYVRAAFAHRRKKLSSNLKEAFPGIRAEEALAELGLSPTARPEELSKEQFLLLTDALRKKTPDAK